MCIFRKTVIPKTVGCLGVIPIDREDSKESEMTRDPGNKRYYARGKGMHRQPDDQAGYLPGPERLRKARSKKATPVTSPAPVKGLNDIPPVA
jgi:hypothetical protein